VSDAEHEPGLWLPSNRDSDFMVIMPQTFGTCRPYFENSAPKMELMLMPRPIVAYQPQKGT
jgi:hypothetical protein